MNIQLNNSAPVQINLSLNEALYLRNWLDQWDGQQINDHFELWGDNMDVPAGVEFVLALRSALAPIEAPKNY